MTKEKILNKAFAEIVKKQSDLHEDIDPILLNAMQEWAEQYHQEQLKQVEGECFDELFVWTMVENQTLGSLPPEKLQPYLNAKAAAFAAAKTEELTRWKESAMKVMNNLDLQEVGNELGIGLGEDISSQVLPKVKELKGRMYTEEQVRKSIWLAQQSYKEDGGITYEYKPDEIINQLKASK